MLAFIGSGYIYLQKNMLKSVLKFWYINKCSEATFYFLNNKGWPETTIYLWIIKGNHFT